MIKELWTISASDYCLSAEDGVAHDRNGDAYPVGDDYDTMAEALEALHEIAEGEKPEVSATRYGIGAITRTVYEVTGYRWDTDDEGDYREPGRYLDADGNEQEIGWRSPAYVLDVLDSCPELRERWRRCMRSYCEFLDYEADDYEVMADER